MHSYNVSTFPCLKYQSLNPCFNGRCTRTSIYKDELFEGVEGLNPCFNGRCTRTYIKTWMPKSMVCLNPCFNGRCTRTFYGASMEKIIKVLILVLMEDALVHISSGRRM